MTPRATPRRRFASVPSRRRELLLLLAILVVAVALRLAYLNDFSRSPFFEHPAVDALDYVRWAREIEAGDLVWDKISIHSPFYPYFLAGLLRAFGDDLGAARTVQAVLLGIGSGLILWSIARRCGGPLAAVVSGLLAAMLWPLVYHSADFLVEAFAVLLNGLALLAFIRARGRPLWIALGSVLLGLSVASHPTTLAFVPVAAVWAAWPHADRDAATRGRDGGPRPGALRGSGWAALFRLAIVGAAVTLIVSPVLLRNHRLTGEWLLQANGGLNFYIGNNESADGTPNVRPGRPWRQLIALPVEKGITTLSGQDAFFRAEAFRWMRQQPADALRLLGKKLFLFWNAYETRASQNTYYFRRASPALSLPWPGFGVLAPLALVGVVAVLLRRSRETALLVLYVATYTVATAIFVVSGRYRLPVVAGAIPLAGIAVARIVDAFRHGRRRAAAAGVALAILLGFAMRMTPGDVIVRDDACELYDLGTIHLLNGEYAEAEVALRSAFEQAPDDGRILVNLGTVYLRTGRVAESLPILRRAVKLFPESPDAWNTLGVAAAALQEDDEADKAYRTALELHPRLATAHLNFGKFLLRRGDREAALQHLDAARRLGLALPQWAQAALAGDE